MRCLSALCCLLVLLGAVRAAPPTAKPEEVGLRAADLRALSEGVRQMLADDEMPGAEVMIVKDGKTVLHETVGLSDLDEKRPYRPDTIVCIRSMTKPLVGLAVLLLVEQNKVSLDDLVSKHLPSFDNEKSKAVTLRQLLTHTGGFPLTHIKKSLSEYASQQDVADEAGKLGPVLKPGERFHYSDCDTEGLAAVVARVSGKPAERFIRERILEPLGMKDTHLVLTDKVPDRDRVGSNHAGSAGLWHRYWAHRDKPFFPFFLGAAAGYSTPADYARFLDFWMRGCRHDGRRLLSERLAREALKPAAEMLALSFDPQAKTPMPTGFPGTKVHYGLHWMLYETGKPRKEGLLPPFGHGGSDGTGAWCFPEHNLIACFFTQARNGRALFRFEALLAPLAGLPAVAAGRRLPREDLLALAGPYRAENGAHAHVYVQGPRLFVEVPGRPPIAMSWPGKDGLWRLGEGTSASLRFEAPRDGKAPGFELRQPRGPLAFKRVTLPADAPSAKQLQELLGKNGADALARLKSLHFRGKLDAGAAGSGPYTAVAAGRDQLQREMELNKQKVKVVSKDGKAWQRSAAGLEELTGILAEQYAGHNAFDRHGNWARSAEAVEVVRKEKLGDDETWVVRIGHPRLPPTTRHVRVRDGRLLQEKTWLTVKGVGTVPLTIEFGDYREVSGVPLPFRTVSQSTLTGRQVTEWAEVKANAELPADTFKP